MTVANPSTVVIEELKGRNLQIARKVELVGAALPFQGAAWSTHQKLVTTWYAGNGLQATQHVLGPEEVPSEWEGFWRTNRLIVSPSTFTADGGSPEQVFRAAELRDVLDDIFLHGALLRVTWAGGEGRKVVRLGRASDWEFAHDREDDIGWKVSFEWTGRGALQQRVVSFRGDDSTGLQRELAVQLSQLQSALAGLNAQSVQVNRAIPKSADTFTLGDLEAMANGPQELMKSLSQAANNVANRIDRVGALVEKVATTPAQLAGSLSDIATNATSVLAQFADRMGRVVPDTYTRIGSDKVTQVLKAASYFGEAQERSEAAASASVKLRASASRKNSGLKLGGALKDRARPADIIAVHLPRQGETFVSLSQRYYKTPDHSAEIAKANGFPQYQVTPPIGRPLIIPNLTAVENLSHA